MVKVMQVKNLKIDPTSSNTVQLDHHGFFGWSIGLRPVAVAGSFDVPLGVLAFDHAGVGARFSSG